MSFKACMVNNAGNPKGGGCLGTVCQNVVTGHITCQEYNQLKFIKYFLLKCGIYKKIFWYNSQDVISHMHTHVFTPKLSFADILRITAKGEIKMVFTPCNHWFLPLFCSYFCHHFWHPRSICVPKPDYSITLPCKTCIPHPYLSANLSSYLHCDKWYPYIEKNTRYSPCPLQSCTSHQADAAASQLSLLSSEKAPARAVSRSWRFVTSQVFLLQHRGELQKRP